MMKNDFFKVSTTYDFLPETTQNAKDQSLKKCAQTKKKKNTHRCKTYTLFAPHRI